MGDLVDPPARSAEHECLTNPALEHHLLVEFADPPGADRGSSQKDAVESPVGNRPAVDHRDAPGPFAGFDEALRAVPRDTRSQLGEVVRRIPARQHVEDVLEGAACKLRKRSRPPHDVEQIVHPPLVDGRHRHDLLGQDVERVARVSRRFHEPVVHGPGDRRAGQQVRSVLREQERAARGVNVVPAPADPLKARRHRGRRFDLHDQVNRAHVDAEFER